MGHSKSQFALQLSQANTKLKLGFSTETVYKKWYEALRSRVSDSPAPRDEPIQKDASSEEAKEVPKIQAFLAEKVKTFTKKDLCLVGNRGSARFYLENADLFFTCLLYTSPSPRDS